MNSSLNLDVIAKNNAANGLFEKGPNISFNASKKFKWYRDLIDQSSLTKSP